MPKYKLTIVTPSFNQGEFISDTYDSILKQKVTAPIEYIVNDGGSTDDTVKISKEYAKKFARKGIDFKFTSQKDKGQSDAINKGWKKAQGEIITYLNSDDYYEPDTLQKIIDFFDKNKKYKWAYGGWNFVTRSGKSYKKVLPPKYDKRKLLDWCNISQPSTFFKRELLEEFGYLNVDMHLTMDYDLWLRFATKCQPGVMNFVISNMRYYADAKSGSRTKEHLKASFALSKSYSRPFSFQRFRQIYYYCRGLAVILVGKDITRRVSAKESN
ncbi:MAG: glycosyltransferase family 2 protein [Patescibacteria group bacterium]|jgi:glycosyltransferase involved in cell wall biosynthesis